MTSISIGRTAATTLLALTLGGGAWAQDAGFKDLLDASAKDKKGLVFYVKGQTIAGVVTKVQGDLIEVKNQTHGRILIKSSSIDAVAGN